MALTIINWPFCTFSNNLCLYWSLDIKPPSDMKMGIGPQNGYGNPFPIYSLFYSFRFLTFWWEQFPHVRFNLFKILSSFEVGIYMRHGSPAFIPNYFFIFNLSLFVLLCWQASSNIKMGIDPQPGLESEGSRNLLNFVLATKFS